MSLQRQIRTLKQNWLLVIGALLLVFLVIGQPSLSSIAADTPSYAQTLEARSGASASSDRQVTQTSSLTVETKNIAEQSQSTKTIAERNGGLILNENQNHENGELEQVWYEISVPVANQTSLINELRDLGAVQSYDVRVNDVTEQYTDLEDDLEAAREKLERLNGLYDDGDNELKVNVLDQLIDQEQRVRSLERQLNDVEERTAQTTVYFTLTDHDYLTTSFISFEALLTNLVESMNTLLNWIVYLIPWAVIGGLGYWVYRRFA